MQRRPPIATGLQLVAALVGGFTAADQRRCGARHDDAPRESAQLEAALRCARGADDDSRRLCFIDALSALDQWREGPSRDAAFSQAESTLSGWPDRHRAARASYVIHERDRRVLDTIRLVRELTDWYPEDTDRHAAERTRLAIHTPLAREITAFTMVRAPVRFAWFAQGPGLSRLRSLTLIDVGDPAKDFDHLLRWSALTTLERVRLRDERALVTNGGGPPASRTLPPTTARSASPQTTPSPSARPDRVMGAANVRQALAPGRVDASSKTSREKREHHAAARPTPNKHRARVRAVRDRAVRRRAIARESCASSLKARARLRRTRSSRART